MVGIAKLSVNVGIFLESFFMPERERREFIRNQCSRKKYFEVSVQYDIENRIRRDPLGQKCT